MNTDIRVAVSFKSHRKRKRLRLLLGAGSTDYLIDLWLSTAMNHPSGVLSGMDELDIALDAGWEGEPQVFVAALLECGFLEKSENGVYSLHDWEDHQGYVVHAEERRQKARNAAAKRWGNKDNATGMPGACQEHTDSNACGNAPSPSPIPAPKPDPKPKRKQIAPNPDGFRAESGTLVCDKALAKERTVKKEPPPRDDLSPYYLPVKSPDMSEVAFLKAENWKTWVDTYGEAFCMACLKGAYAWALSNPAKAKTVAGVHAYFNNWLKNEQNKPGGPRASPPGRVGFGRYDGGQGQDYGQSDFGASGGNST